MPEEMTADLHGLAQAILQRSGTARTIIAIAGAPGSGKSTVADDLAALLDRMTQGSSAAVLPMDGYHFDDRVLDQLGRRAAKGAPDTFDVAGLLHMLGRLKLNQETAIAVPVFDRDLEISRAGARLIPDAVRYLVIEGNYLLLDRAPWRDLHGLFDITVSISVREEVLRQRLIARWRGYGLPPEGIEAKVEDNDLPNGRLVTSGSIGADIVLRQG